MGEILNTIIRLRSDISRNWLDANPVLAMGEPGFEVDTLKLKIGDGISHWVNLDYVTSEQPVEEISNSIISVNELPEIGNPSYFYKVNSEQKIYFWNENENSFNLLNFAETPSFEDTNTDNIVLVATYEILPYPGQENLLYKTLNDQKIYYWNPLYEEYSLITIEDTNVDNIIVKDNKEAFPSEGLENYLYKDKDNQKLYYFNSSSSEYEELLLSKNLPEYIDTNTDNIVIVDELPENGEENKLYRLNNQYYFWNGETFIGLVPESKNNISVVQTFADLPEIGEGDVLYKVTSEQLLYNFNTSTNAYEKLGQGSGISMGEGYNITLQSTIDRIFAAIEGSPIEISFRYFSLDADGLNDGPGVGTLYVNNAKRATFAIPQKAQTIDITKYLSLGENNVELKVENSEGTDRAKSLAYSIEVVNLYLTTNIKAMDTYFSEVGIPFTITGPGIKTLHYIMDNKEIAFEEIDSKTQLAHIFKVPMQTAGDHIFKIYATREVNNMTVYSNTLTLGMMFVTDEMVDTFILSTFEKEKESQGEIITIPYVVYNPFLETSDIVLTIYDANNEIYFQKPLTVDQTVQNWVTQDFPAGEIVFEIQAHSDSGVDAIKRFPMTIEASTFDLEILRDSLVLEFSSAGRSNSEKNPEYWKYGDYEATFERFAWSGADGWVESDSGETVLRFLPKNKMTIPFYPFATDKRNTGYTIELEIETRDVADYDAVVVSCKDENGLGFEVKSQSVVFKTELSELSMMFKDGERVRITIVVEPATLNRFIYMFVNGIMVGLTQYESGDNFKQATPVPITIGSDKSGIDLYKIRFYDRNFTYIEQLNNYICDRSTNAERFELKERNDIYDISGNLTIGSIPPNIPYMVLQCPELPQFKGDKKKKQKCYFVDQLRPERCFSAEGVQFDVQGTSSAGYPIKNFKVAFKDGIIRPDGTHDDGYDIYEGGILAETLCLKADFASSEQANNIILVDYYDELVRDYFLTPAQKEDDRIRTGVRGTPIIVFWENTDTGEITFNGQYNMNDDKSNEIVFGFDREKYPQLECWEFCNNTSSRVLFQQSEYEKTMVNDDGETVPAWTADFEARFPDLDNPYQDYTNFKRMTDWVVSTDRRQATNEDLENPVTYAGVTYEKDTVEYRLAKFKAEFEDYFEKSAMIFYYIFTETFLMIDNRAKNMFLTSFDGEKWFPIPYDFDTAIGINNEGKLVFDYDLEDFDQVNGDDVFNGQQSTLWMNVRDAFPSDLRTMYQNLRQSGKFSFNKINAKMTAHQETCWPEAIWNTDANIKYIQPFFTTGVNYFEMCQGNKKAQREWWLYNAFKYRDSKYYAGDAVNTFAFFRAYALGDITVTPYQHLWPRVEYTRSYPYTVRSKRNVPNVMINQMDNVQDTEIWIDSIDRIISLGDMSALMTDTVDFSKAEKLQEVILGNPSYDYENAHLSELSLGTNRLLTYLNVENCTNLSKAINVENCFNLETIKAKGSALPTITFPIGGHLKELYLPDTFSNLTLRNQHMIEVFDLSTYENLTSIWIDDTPGLPIEDIILGAPKLNRVRLVNLTWQVSSEQKLKEIFEKLKTCGGLDASGKNTDQAVVTGYVEIDSISDEFLEELNEYFKELIVIVDGKTRFFIRYLNWDNSLIYKKAVSQGDDVFDPIGQVIDPNTGELLAIPTKEGTEDTQYRFTQWSNLPTNIQGPQNIVAMYETQYRVQFLDGDNNVVNTQWVPTGAGAIDPFLNDMIQVPTKTSDAQYNYIFAHWVENFDIINEPFNVHSYFSEFLRQYKVSFYNDNKLLQETEVYYGNCAVYYGEESEIKKYIGNEPSPYYEFAYWSPSLTEPITGITTFKAQFTFDGYIKDDWATIAENVANGNLDNYGYSGKKTMELTFTNQGVTKTQIIDLEIVDKNHDDLVEISEFYNNGSSKAGLTFRGELNLNRAINESPKRIGENSGLNVGGWEMSDIRDWMNDEFLNCFPDEVKNNIKLVNKISDTGYYRDGLVTTQDKIFLPALEELNLKVSATDEGQGTPYILFTDNNSRKSDNMYWTRSTYPMVHSWWTIDFDGRSTFVGGGNLLKVIFFFCI